MHMFKDKLLLDLWKVPFIQVGNYFVGVYPVILVILVLIVSSDLDQIVQIQL